MQGSCLLHLYIVACLRPPRRLSHVGIGQLPSLTFRCSTCWANSCNPAAYNQTPYDLLFLRLASVTSMIALSQSGITSRSCMVTFWGILFKVLILRCTPSVK